LLIRPKLTAQYRLTVLIQTDMYEKIEESTMKHVSGC